MSTFAIECIRVYVCLYLYCIYKGVQEYIGEGIHQTETIERADGLREVLDRPSRFTQGPPLSTGIEADTSPPIYNTLVKSRDASMIAAALCDHLQS